MKIYFKERKWVMDSSFIEKKAEEVLNTFAVKDDSYNGAAVDIIKMASDIGFSVVAVSLPENKDGMILKKDNLKLICVNSNRNTEDKRFIIAHELAHYYLDSDNDGYVANFRDNVHGRSDNENHMDFFAACLLMPREKFIASYEQTKDLLLLQNIETTPFKIAKYLAKEYVVTELSALRRIEEVGLQKIFA